MLDETIPSILDDSLLDRIAKPADKLSLDLNVPEAEEELTMLPFRIII